MITSTAEKCLMWPLNILEYEPTKSKMTDQSRLASYFSYPYSSEVSATVLAEAGFYYDGHGDAVMCRHCGLRYSGWQKGDDPRTIHMKMSPSCPFFQTSGSEDTVYVDESQKGKIGLAGACGGPEDAMVERSIEDKTHQHTNTSIHTAPLTVQETDKTIPVPQVPEVADVSISGQDVPDNSVHREDTLRSLTNSGISNPRNDNEVTEQCESEIFARTEVSANGVATNETQTVESHDQNTREDVSNTSPDSASHSDTISTVNSTGSLETVRPQYQQFAILATRLNSYSQWPQHLKQRPDSLAKAGLFYEGTNDFVRCFHCAGGLREWDPEDDPFYEHARWFPFCPFMRLTKGDKFIMGVQSGTIKPPTVQQDDELKSGQSNRGLNVFDHPAVLSIMEMGYSKTILTKAITVYRKRNRTDLSAEKLLPIVWEVEENGNVDVNTGDDIFENEQTTNQNETETRCESKSDGTEQLPAVESITQGVDELTEENRVLREQKTCKVCLDEEASIVFLPCGHLVTCPMCASALRKCPVCRTYIRGTVKAIVS